MGRQEKIARSIVRALVWPNFNGNQKRSNSNPLRLMLALFSAFFSLYQLLLLKIRPADFAKLRREHWDVSDDDYIESFRPPQSEAGKEEEGLTAIGDMGFSGSTFYATADQKYLVKSVPRHSEHSFFRDDLLTPYVQYMATHPRSLLVRICDFLGASGSSVGRIFRMAPSHHIVMENIMYGKDEAKKRGDADWENWDLKPTSYFYPERDIADGALTSEATKDQLADEFHDKIILSQEQADEFFARLEEDTKLLAEHNAVDYSLFLVRMKLPEEDVQREADPEEETAISPPEDGPSVPPGPPTWRTGIASADGKHVYRASILDFFWAKHKLQPKLMTLLINLWNACISKDGPMSITTTPEEYRERFLRMCRKYVEVKKD
ncbi:phosphatidylinositol-4-phosphate 5-kinase-domain-containing protein [Podospora australis]|uniref:Phosphatidylinositol-4-phosphate 5-kinase-domain-containing protein n=1 Tax=Podospora australis TaxID=1536484 RepID=A0AAN6WRG5_9PEZI|nr:phosphatidylinositol-4-phosphate 5-kinase-domain-containing protein [Podospora australis]